MLIRCEYLAENFSKIPPGDFEKSCLFIPEIGERRENLR